MGKFAIAGIMVALASLPGSGQAESLLDFYQQALASNPSLKSREFGIDRARAQEGLARSSLLPQLMTSANYGVNRYSDNSVGSQNYDSKRWAVQARQALFDLPTYRKIEGAQATILQTEQELQAVRMALAGEVIDRYLEVLQARDAMLLLQAEKTSIQSQLKRLQAMRERQLATVTALYEVEAYYQTLQTKEIEARNAEAVAFERLHETTGVAAKSVASLSRDSFPPVPRTEQDWLADASRNNPGLEALRHAIAAADKVLESSRAQHYPQLSLAVSRTHSDSGFDNRTQSPYMVNTAGVQLNIPLYEGGRVDATVRDARAQRSIAEQRYEQSRRAIERETRTAYLNAIASIARIQSTNQEVLAQEKATEAQEKSFERGVTTIVDVLNAHQRLLKARSDQFKARYDYIRDLTSLRIQAGSLKDEDVAEINSWMKK